jgi:hypothetical protein
MEITAIEIGFAVAVSAAGLLIARKGLDQRETVGLFAGCSARRFLRVSVSAVKEPPVP